MSRAPSQFRQCDVKKAIQAVKAAGVRVDRVRVSPDGAIEIFVDHSGQPVALDNVQDNEWDGVK